MEEEAQGEKNGRKRRAGLLTPYGKHRNWAQAPRIPDESHIPTRPPSFFICKYASACMCAQTHRQQQHNHLYTALPQSPELWNESHHLNNWKGILIALPVKLSREEPSPACLSRAKHNGADSCLYFYRKDHYPGSSLAAVGQLRLW